MMHRRGNSPPVAWLSRCGSGALRAPGARDDGLVESSVGRATGRLVVAVAIGSLLVLALGCEGEANGARLPEPPVAGGEKGPPDDCRSVEPGEDLEELVESAEAGAAFCLEAGTYHGQFELTKSVQLWGNGETVIRNSGEGSTFRIVADDVGLHDLRIVGSGDRYTRQDAGVFIQDVDDVVVDGLVMRDVLFGISAQKSNRLVLRDNDIECRHQDEMGMRGDGIRFWEVRRSRIAYNDIAQCRDLVMWYAPENVIVGNRYSDGRYGTHFMYASRNIVRDNVYADNSVGIFVMYSRHLRIADNVFSRSAGSSGMGLGLKESGDLEVVANMFVDNAQGTYIDTSPLQNNNELLYLLNDFRLNDTAVVFHNEPRRTVFRANTFRHNGSPARIQGGGTATTADWGRNYFGTYAGYDFDHDGIGDVAFEMRSFSQTLRGRYPKLDLLTGTPAMGFLETATRLAPLYQPKVMIRDGEPLMRPPTRGDDGTNREQMMEELGFLRIRDGENVRLVDPPEKSLSKEY